MKANKFLYFLILILFSACSEKVSDAPSNEILIVSSYEDSLYSAPIVEEFLKSQNRYLPREENYYSIKWIRASYFEENTSYPSILMLKLNNPSDNTGDKLYDRIFYNKEYGSDVNFIKNFYIEKQSLIGVEAKDVIELNEILNEYNKNIISEIDDNINHLILKKYYKKPKNEIIMDEIEKKYGISVFIDHEYQKFDTDNDILWIGRGFPHWNDPYRWIIIREIELCEDPKLCLSYIQDTFNQIILDSSYMSISPYSAIESYRYKHNNNYAIGGSYQYFNIVNNPDDTFKDADGSGKWDSAEILIKDYNFNSRWDPAGLDSIPNVGGPYISYIYNKENSSILLIGLINDPVGDKMIYLKQMESIFRDIK